MAPIHYEDLLVETPLNVFGNFHDIATGSLEIINWDKDLHFEYF